MYCLCSPAHFRVVLDMADAASPHRLPGFGGRFLSDPTRVYEHNAWDHVEWDEEQQKAAEESVRENSLDPVPLDQAVGYEERAGQHWDNFYHQHQNRFFKDRHWLFTEFSELRGSAQPGQDKFCVFEVGCGAGNTVFPILQTNSDQSLFVYCCDFAPSAVQIVKEHELYDPQRCCAFQCDVTDSTHSLPFPPSSVDIIILIFVLSAIHPAKVQDTVNRLAGCLRPGGVILFRDYGRFDMAQLRFRKGHCLSDNFYVRGDGTRVYFFIEEEVAEVFTNAGLECQQLCVDRRLQVNRGRQLKMYRVWIQAKYRKPVL